MLFCQLAQAHSLREICYGLASCEGKLSHLGIEAPSRTTLSYANTHWPCLTALLRMNLFVYRDLWTWLETPYTAPPPQLLMQSVLALG